MPAESPATSGRLRVLLVSNFFPPQVKGGAEIACSNLAAWLARQGHEVGVMTLATPGADDSASVAADGVRVFARQIPNVYHTHQHLQAASWKKPLWHLIDHFSPFAGRALDSVLRDFSPDVVNTHNLQGMGYNLWRKLGCRDLPVVATLHDPAIACIRSSMFKGGQNCATLCAPCHRSQRVKAAHFRRVRRLAFVSPSRALLDLLTPWLPAHRLAARHIPYPLFFPPAQPRAAASGRIELLFVGQVSEHKGVRFLIDLLEALPERDRFRLNIVGRGPLLESLQTRYAGAEWIRCKGFVPPDQVGREMAASDLLVAPSIWFENAPLVASEAIFLGLPMLTSDRGGLPEMVQDGVTGRALSIADATAWTAALRSIAQDPSLLRTWRANAEQRREQFDVNRLGERYVAAFRDTIAGRHD